MSQDDQRSSTASGSMSSEGMDASEAKWLVKHRAGHHVWLSGTPYLWGMLGRHNFLDERRLNRQGREHLRACSKSLTAAGAAGTVAGGPTVMLASMGVFVLIIVGAAIHIGGCIGQGLLPKYAGFIFPEFRSVEEDLTTTKGFHQFYPGKFFLAQTAASAAVSLLACWVAGEASLLMRHSMDLGVYFMYAVLYAHDFSFYLYSSMIGGINVFLAAECYRLFGSFLGGVLFLGQHFSLTEGVGLLAAWTGVMAYEWKVMTQTTVRALVVSGEGLTGRVDARVVRLLIRTLGVRQLAMMMFAAVGAFFELIIRRRVKKEIIATGRVTHSKTILPYFARTQIAIAVAFLIWTGLCDTELSPWTYARPFAFLAQNKVIVHTALALLTLKQYFDVYVGRHLNAVVQTTILVIPQLVIYIASQTPWAREVLGLQRSPGTPPKLGSDFHAHHFDFSEFMVLLAFISSLYTFAFARMDGDKRHQAEIELSGKDYEKLPSVAAA